MSAGDLVIIFSRLCALRVSTLVPFIIVVLMGHFLNED